MGYSCCSNNSLAAAETPVGLQQLAELFCSILLIPVEFITILITTGVTSSTEQGTES